MIYFYIKNQNRVVIGRFFVTPVRSIILHGNGNPCGKFFFCGGLLILQVLQILFSPLSSRLPPNHGKGGSSTGSCRRGCHTREQQTHLIFTRRKPRRNRISFFVFQLRVWQPRDKKTRTVFLPVEALADLFYPKSFTKFGQGKANDDSNPPFTKIMILAEQ